MWTVGPLQSSFYDMRVSPCPGTMGVIACGVPIPTLAHVTTRHTERICLEIITMSTNVPNGEIYKATYKALYQALLCTFIDTMI